MDVTIQCFVFGELLNVDFIEASELAAHTSAILLVQKLWDLFLAVVQGGLQLTVSGSWTDSKRNATPLSHVDTLQVDQVSTVFIVDDCVSPLVHHERGIICTLLSRLSGPSLSEIVLNEHLRGLRAYSTTTACYNN